MIDDCPTPPNWNAKTWKSITKDIKVGCGTLYVIVDYNNDGSIHRIRIPQKCKFKCSVVMRDVLARQSTYQIRRDPQQLIKDLKGYQCEMYSAGCDARSCFDAMAMVIKELTTT